MPGPNVPYTALDADQVLKQSFDEQNDRIRVDANVTATIGVLEVEISAADGDSILISDGEKNVTVTQAGDKNALDVNIVGTVSSLKTNTYFDDVFSVPSNTLTTIISHTFSTDGKLQKVDASGTNIGIYYVLLNGNVIDKRYTYFGSQLNAEFNFQDGIDVETGDQILVQVEHFRSTVGDFNARLQTKE